MKKRSIYATTAIAVALIAGAAATPAQAVSYSSGGHVRATATYSSHTLKITDNYADGYGGRAQWSTNVPSATGNLDASGGAGTSATKKFGSTGGTIFFYACIKNGSTTVKCSDWDSATI